VQAPLSQSRQRSAVVDIGNGSRLTLRDILTDNTVIPPAQCAILNPHGVVEGIKINIDDCVCSVQNDCGLACVIPTTYGYFLG